MSKESESYRLQMLRQLEYQYGDSKPPEVLDAEKLIAKYREEKLKAGETIARLRKPLPNPDLCPDCWFLRGHKNVLYAATAEDPSQFDRFKCHICPYDVDQPIER